MDYRHKKEIRFWLFFLPVGRMILLLAALVIALGAVFKSLGYIY